MDVRRIISNPKRQCFRNMKLAVRGLCLAVVPLLLSFHAGGDGLQRSDAQPVLQYLSTGAVLDAVKNQTGYQIQIIGNDPESKTTKVPSNIALPQDMDRLARSLGIDSYAATIDSEALTIKLLILRNAPEKGEKNPAYLSLGMDQRPADKLPSQTHYLTSTEEQMVVSFYEKLQNSTPSIDTTITRDDKRKVQEEIPPNEPYLTAEDETSIALFYKQLQNDIYNDYTLITSDNDLGSNGNE